MLGVGRYSCRMRPAPVPAPSHWRGSPKSVIIHAALTRCSNGTAGSKPSFPFNEQIHHCWLLDCSSSSSGTSKHAHCRHGPHCRAPAVVLVELSVPTTIMMMSIQKAKRAEPAHTLHGFPTIREHQSQFTTLKYRPHQDPMTCSG